MTRVVGFTYSCRKFLIVTCSQDTNGGISYMLVVTLPLEADLEQPLRDYSGAVSMLPCMSDEDFLAAYAAWKLRPISGYISAPGT